MHTLSLPTPIARETTVPQISQRVAGGQIDTAPSPTQFYYATTRQPSITSPVVPSLWLGEFFSAYFNFKHSCAK
jgi:hypothetical protein